MRFALTLLVSSALAGACTGGAVGGSGGSVLQVVAAQNFWGDIAAQLGGVHASVQSVVSDPNADPHEYEGNANDARALATADLVILNGAGYDAWANRLLQATPNERRKVLVVADLVGMKAGDDPHFWYDPDYVLRVADAITAQYRALDPADATYFAGRRSALALALQPYMQLLADIKTKFAGVPVGATETMFVYLAGYLGLDLVSPSAFMQAVSEGNDPPAGAVVTFEQQIAQKAIRVLVYDVQTETAVTTNLVTAARQRSIPVVGLSETLHPEKTSFQAWQVDELTALENALESSS